MKTTIDLDEGKLKRVMKLTGIKTRKQAIDYALTEAERSARIGAFYRKSFFVRETGDVIDPNYDVLEVREKEKPRRDDPG
jgi:hypothetical protein